MEDCLFSSLKHCIYGAWAMSIHENRDIGLCDLFTHQEGCSPEPRLPGCFGFYEYIVQGIRESESESVAESSPTAADIGWLGDIRKLPSAHLAISQNTLYDNMCRSIRRLENTAIIYLRLSMCVYRNLLVYVMYRCGKGVRLTQHDFGNSVYVTVSWEYRSISMSMCFSTSRIPQHVRITMKWW